MLNNIFMMYLVCPNRVLQIVRSEITMLLGCGIVSQAKLHLVCMHYLQLFSETESATVYLLFYEATIEIRI